MTATRLAGWFGAAGLALAIAAPSASAQPRTINNERHIPAETHVNDKDDIWTMELVCMDPRVITVDVPGRGKKIVWYMRYQVINRTGEPRVFIPDFELVTHDKNTVHRDEVLPAVQEAIRKVEDPTNRTDMKNSVTISEQPIPPTKPDSAPKAVHGVAIWPDVYDRAKDTNYFSVFVSGLSNGWTEDDNKVIRRKTLQMKFRKHGDSDVKDGTDIKWFIDPQGKSENPQWIYRATNAAPAKPAPKADGEPKKEPEPKKAP
jgi:hypothetical protein